MQISICTFHRLLPIFQIYYAKPPKSQGYVFSAKRALTIRSSMLNDIHHPFKHCLLILSVTCKSTDSAHFVLRIRLMQFHHCNDNLFFHLSFPICARQKSARIEPLTSKYFNYSIGLLVCSISCFSVNFLQYYNRLERVWKMLSAKWGVQIAGMILGARSSFTEQSHMMLCIKEDVRNFQMTSS